MLGDLPWGETFFMGVGPSQVEVELIERGFGEEVGAAGESFQFVELALDEAVGGFDVALEGVGGGRNALMLGTEEGNGARKVGA